MSMPAGAWADEALLATRFRGGEFLLPLTEGLFGATAPPITRYGRPLRVDSALFADVGPQVVHDFRGGQRDFVLGLGDLDEDLADCCGRQRFQSNTDRRQRGLIADQQVPV